MRSVLLAYAGVLALLAVGCTGPITVLPVVTPTSTPTPVDPCSQEERSPEPTSVPTTAEKGGHGEGDDLLPLSSFSHSESFSWGPPRDTFTMCDPPHRTGFNSIVDSPIGDSRFFYYAKPANGDAESYTNNLELTAGHTYNAVVYFWNDVAESVEGGASIGARVHLDLPRYVTKPTPSSATICAENASPDCVFDGINLIPKEPGVLQIDVVPESIQIDNSAAADGFKLDLGELRSTDGALIGCDQLDGVLTGEGRCQGFVLFDFKVVVPGFVVDMSGTEGTPGYTTVSAGQTLGLFLTFTNTSDVDQSDISMSIKLPIGATFVANGSSVRRHDKDSWQDWTGLSGEISSDGHEVLFLAGHEVVPYSQGEQAQVYVQIQLSSDQLDCEGRWLRVVGSATQDGVRIESPLTANIEAAC